MAKARQRVATGLSISDISSMSMEQFKSYTPTQQREIVSRLASAGNKRLRTFEKRGIESPAVIRVQASGGKFSVRGKSGKELEKEFFRAKQFLKSKYGTVKGWQKTQKEIKETISPDGYEGAENDIQAELSGIAFMYFDILKDIDSRFSLVEKYKYQEKIAEMLESGKDQSDIIQSMLFDLEIDYMEMQEDYNKGNVSFGQRLEQEKPKRYRKRKNKR